MVNIVKPTLRSIWADGSRARMLLGMAFVSIMAGTFSRCNGQEKPSAMKIAGYHYVLPTWWENVYVEVPLNLKNYDDVRKYVSTQYGKDVGTKTTWKQALKTWAIASQRLELSPTHIAHCHVTGEEYEAAVEIYTALYKLPDGQKHSREWHEVYLAYKAGATYELLKDKEKAAEWYDLSAKHIGSNDVGIVKYAKQSAERSKQLRKQ